MRALCCHRFRHVGCRSRVGDLCTCGCVLCVVLCVCSVLVSWVLKCAAVFCDGVTGAEAECCVRRALRVFSAGVLGAEAECCVRRALRVFCAGVLGAEVRGSVGLVCVLASYYHVARLVRTSEFTYSILVCSHHAIFVEERHMQPLWVATSRQRCCLPDLILVPIVPHQCWVGICHRYVDEQVVLRV